jgi:hypothetical protein
MVIYKIVNWRKAKVRYNFVNGWTTGQTVEPTFQFKEKLQDPDTRTGECRQDHHPVSLVMRG